ncbi:hypothetical protein [Rummeliibacillus pycnus]|uniref:hypothetical protein n=1 Tax=Rummeliibacillus pycnus TaxID=101070 RepID=UPI000C9A6DCA|nr:hypothetical protein [Rummeliibacillus pycnus]
MEERSKERLEDIERERSIQLQTIKPITQLHIQPIERSARVISKDFIELVKEYEYQNGQLNIREMKAFGLVDFTSEEDGNTRFILLTSSLELLSQQLELNDYRELNGSVYVYLIDQHKIVEEVKTEKIIGI